MAPIQKQAKGPRMSKEQKKQRQKIVEDEQGKNMVSSLSEREGNTTSIILHS